MPRYGYKQTPEHRAAIAAGQQRLRLNRMKKLDLARLRTAVKVLVEELTCIQEILDNPQETPKND